MAGIGQIHWNQGKKVTHFTWFGEPWIIINSNFEVNWIELGRSWIWHLVRSNLRL